MTRGWAVHPPPEEAGGVATELQIHPLVISILLRRGLRTPGEILRYLNPSLKDLESPYAFADMKKAVERIRRAIAAREKILIYGDYDVDGVTASAILYPVLKSLGADVEIHLPHRVKDGYGMNRGSLERLIHAGATGQSPLRLVITVDNGITSVDAVRYLKDNGADVILVDHHIPKDEVPPADAILSAAVPGKEGGDAALAACGLAFKLAWALLEDYEKVEPYLDLVALGTVADLAPVENDNRILLKEGLPRLSKTKRPGLRALMEAAGIHPAYVSYRDIAFGLGPRINAAGRMDSPMSAFRLLVTDNLLEARNLAQVLEAGNRERQRVEADAYKQAADLVERTLTPAERHILVVGSPDWHEGVLGIVASRLVERFGRPSIVISLKNGLGKGSGRSLPHFSLFEHVLKCEELLETFGGHAQACGLTIREERLGDFRRRLNALAGETFSDIGAEQTLWIDGEISPAQLSVKLIEDLERLAPFGPGNRRPLFLSRGLKVRGEIKKRGKDTLQCWMTDAEGKLTCEVIGFRTYERWKAEMKDRRIFDIVYQPTLRNSNGIKSITLELEQWK